MAGILIYSDKTRLALELAEAARQLGLAEDRAYKAVSINHDEQSLELAARGLEVFSIQRSELAAADTAAMASALCQTAEQLDVDTILLSSDRRGKELAGRLAEAWGAGCLTGVKEWVFLEGRTACARSALGGATEAIQIINSPRRVIAISPRAFIPVEGVEKGSVQPMEVKIEASTIKLVETRSLAGDTVDIQAAARLIVVGQGVENQEELTRGQKLAVLLKAEVACSKPVASDKKWLPEDRIVGLSGKLCKPDLAVILGVSGQVQFTVGIREARVIVSINKDENAFMNKMADYVLVGDLLEVLPELEKYLSQ
ncbi:MAG TPA: electron transfer flavoprotein subunit alpha/FixB family protein [Syntrophomonadaceae bacterium]|nr:electron transfer flavoprotein subunit alpha/FixB family protein [Syntrophomonadaceae bacterium]